MNKNYRENIKKSEDFTRSIIKYVYRSVNFFKNNVENPKFFKYSNVDCSVSENIASSVFFLSFWFNFSILNLSEKVPIPEKSVGKSNDKLLKGSPIIFWALGLKMDAPGKKDCKSRAS